MNIDIQTLALVISFAILLMVIIMFVEFLMNKQYSGPGCWTLGTVLTGAALFFNFMGSNPNLIHLGQAGNTAALIGGSVLYYIGILRFLGQRERRTWLFAFWAVITLIAIYATLQENALLRRTSLSLAMALIALLTTRAILKYRTPSIHYSAYFISIVIAFQSVFWIVRAAFPLVDPAASLFTDPVIQIITYSEVFITGVLTTFGFILLINERINAENLEARETSELLFNTNPDAVALTSLSDGIYINMNEGFTRLNGYTRQECLGKTSRELNIWQNYEDRQTLVNALTDKGICKNLEATFRRKDGSSFTGTISARLITLRGEPHLISAIHDITERKLMEDALRESEEKFRLLFTRMTEGFALQEIICDQNGNPCDYRFLEINPAFELLTGLQRAEVIGRLQSQVIPQEDPKWLEIYGRVALTGEPYRFTNYSQVIKRYYEVFAYQPAPRQFAVLFSDITEHMRAEQDLRDAHQELEQHVQERTAELQAANLGLEKAARMKDEFLASMSHELRTPLTGILGLSEVLQLPGYGPLTDRQQNALSHIQDSGQHLLELINDILDLSRLEVGKFSLASTACSLAEICQSSLKNISPQIESKHLQSSFSITDEPILVNADPRRLKQMLANLFSNAIKFTPVDGSLGIEVSCDRSQPPGADPANRMARITVWDTGIGIDPEDLPRLFQSFVQLDARLSRQYPGTGLGLALAQRLAQLHGGSITVQSIANQGSRFTLHLPLLIT